MIIWTINLCNHYYIDVQLIVPLHPWRSLPLPPLWCWVTGSPLAVVWSFVTQASHRSSASTLVCISAQHFQGSRRLQKQWAVFAWAWVCSNGQGIVHRYGYGAPCRLEDTHTHDLQGDPDTPECALKQSTGVKRRRKGNAMRKDLLLLLLLLTLTLPKGRY